MTTATGIGRWRSGFLGTGGAGFVARELGLWGSLYGTYLLLRVLVIADESTAVENGRRIVAAERRLGIFVEEFAQDAAGPAGGILGAYYMLGFAPVVAATCVWLACRRRDAYRELRAVLLASVGLALVIHAAFPAAPPRLVGELGIEDTVGLGARDTNSFLGVPYNPYAAMPSMHVGWSLLVALALRRALRPGCARWLATLHPLVMAVTVTVTGNHYFLDSAAGAGVALAAFAVTSERVRARFARGRRYAAPALAAGLPSPPGARR
ncbi:MAG TPA: phosphatase PAP2 family protein [Gaiellaceae bacterium]|nr:phosphatase PAP2 family protein [Gaiellaceae bacterium]